MILDEKVILPPPPYSKANSPPPGPPGGVWRTLSALPPHLLLQIVYATFSDAYDIEDAREQRKTLYWLTVGLRLVNRVFYTTSMNVLRSVYLPLYDSLIRPPYTSDPFPFSHTSHPPTHAKSLSMSSTQTVSPRSGLTSVQRETPILDLFIALKVRDDVWADDSDLHLSRAESTFSDLFSLMQPRARIEDLVREYGVAEGVVYIDRRRGGKVTVHPLPFSALSVSFSSRRVGLVLTTGGGSGAGSVRGGAASKRTIVEVPRTRDEALEAAARRLVWELRDWLVDGVDGV
ncbi:hypothetical protein DFH08DRAFT_916859 [Mycena albidolilacea]|uniref:Uncharacterized protein n=1 Tax=Mycena albidolilacea TaxID=1033008 RepID=A0AAD6ZJS0_9AGAR|nr:hypothetical protein DFH08DRAFT_916859 [Mycena albidolilacea]